MKRPNGYSAIQIAAHWMVVLLVIVQLISGDAMAEFFDTLIRTQAEGTRPGLGNAVWHVVSGALILAAMLIRLAMRLTHGVPPDSPASPGWDRMLARLVHGALYVVLLAMPLVGAAAYLIPSETLGELHESAVPVLLGLVILHVLGALYHQFVLKDRLIRRMMVPDRQALHVPPVRPN